LELLAGLGVAATLVLPFTPDRAAQGAEEFVKEVLVDALRAQRVVVGADFRFGHRAAGDVALLATLGERFGYSVDGIALVGDDERWSSTRIRAAVAAGDVERAATALGRAHRLEGVVVPGDRRGRTIGYPTANLELPPDAAVPADGIYAGWLLHPAGAPDEQQMPAAISIGTNPTFDGTVRRVEAYALDRDDLELYGEHVAIDFAARLRDTLRFDGVEPLVAQMRRDVDRAREITAR
jgi:riboflavin kinase/FMN adenylyltransferase